jgi:hypothetical protein
MRFTCLLFIVYTSVIHRDSSCPGENRKIVVASWIQYHQNKTVLYWASRCHFAIKEYWLDSIAHPVEMVGMG